MKKKNNIILRIKNVSKRYKENERDVLKNINIDIMKGEFVFLKGPSGSGKTTLLKLLYRMEENEKGLIFFNGKDIERMKKKYLRRKLGIVFQDYQLLMNKTVVDNVKYPLECVGVRPKVAEKKAIEALKKMKMLEFKNKYPKELSGGQQQRVAIARAIVNEPELLICDEPTGNLDNDNAFAIMEHLRYLNNTGTTIIMSTHNEDIVQKEKKKRVITLNSGKILSDVNDNSAVKTELDEFNEAKDLVLMLSGGK